MSVSSRANQEGLRLGFTDVDRACFVAGARRETYVELPAEDSDDGRCGLLKKAMRGTRDAAQVWEM